jgi:hypothetical protein
MTNTARTAPPIPTAEPDDASLGTTLDERTRHLCKLLEKQMLTGKLRLSFGDYIRLIQWREAKGYDRPHKTVVTWSDPWWLGLIGEMEDHPELKVVIADFKAKGLHNRKKDPHAQPSGS